MEAMDMSLAGEERPEVETGEVVEARDGGEGAPSPALSQGAREEGKGTLTPTLSQGEREQEEPEVEETEDAPGAEPEPADEAEWRGRAEAAEGRVAELGDRLGAVEAAAEDLRRIVCESERARQVDRELLIAGVVDLDGARSLVEEQMDGGATALEAVSRVKERRPLLFVARSRGIRATVVPTVEARGARSAEEVAEAARETGDRRLLLRYLRMRRGEG